MFSPAIHDLAATAVSNCSVLRGANPFDITNFFIAFLVLVSPQVFTQHFKLHQEPRFNCTHLLGGPCAIQETARKTGSLVFQTCSITRGHSLWTALAIALALITSTRNLSLARSLQRSLLATIRLNISRSFALALHQSYEPRSPRTFLMILRVSSLKSWITLVTVSTSWLSILQDQPDPFHSLSIAVKCHQVGVQVCRITHACIF